MRQVQPDAEGANATPIAANPAVKRPVATVVVPAWNAWEFTERCLRSLRPTLGSDDQVVVVDNGSTDGTRAGLAGYEWVEVVANDQNLGFARACNQGAALARGSIVVFLNSDTIVPVGWLDELLRPFEESDVGAVGPRSDNVSGKQETSAVPDPEEDPGAFAEFARQWRDRQQGHNSEVRRLIGFCLAVRRSAFDALGGFDERFEVGGFEDDDLCRRLQDSHLRLLIAHASFVHHHGHASFDANDVDWRATQNENQLRFEEKWGADALRRPILATACLIVKDEEQMLPACLESVRDAVDEIVVYDTGSNDRTVPIARAAGARVIEGTWEDSFAQARNAALGHARGEWILSIDADERLQADPEVLRAQLSDPGSDVEAYLVAIENLHGPGNPRSVHTAIRMFRRRVGTWRHRLHEQVVAADDPGRHLRTAYLSGARLIHHGYVAEVFEDRRKADRNLELARAGLEDGELDSSYTLMNLGRALESAGQSEEAVEALTGAAESAADVITKRLAVTNLVYILGRLGRFDEALARLQELRRLSRSQVAADIAEGRTRLAMGDTVEGLAMLARIPSRARDDDGMEYGPHVVAAIRGEALASLGRFGDAADVVLDAVRSEGVLEADVGELVRWLLQAERSPAEITASLSAEDLVPMLGRVLRQPPPLADVLLEGAWVRFPDRLEPLAAAASVGSRLPLARALVWSGRLRQRGLAASCPLLAIGQDDAVDPVIRARAAAALYGSFHDDGAIAVARSALDALAPSARRASEQEIDRLAPSLRQALRDTEGTTSGARSTSPPRSSGGPPRFPNLSDPYRHPWRRPRRHKKRHPCGPCGAGPPGGSSHSGLGPSAPSGARHQARRSEHRRALRRDGRRGRHGSPLGRRAPGRRNPGLHDVVPPGPPGRPVALDAPRRLGLPLRRERPGGPSGADDRLRAGLRPRALPGPLHRRRMDLGRRPPLAVDGRLGPHGARDLDPDRVRVAQRPVGLRRPGPLHSRSGRETASAQRRVPDAAVIRRPVRNRRRLRQRFRSAESAGGAAGIPLSLLVAGRSSPDHRYPSRRPVPCRARAAPRCGGGTPRHRGACRRPLVSRRTRSLPGRGRLLRLAPPRRRGPG